MARLRFFRTAAAESPSSAAISTSLNPSQCQAMTCRCFGGQACNHGGQDLPGDSLLFQRRPQPTLRRACRPVRDPRPAMSPGPRPGSA